MAVLIDQDDAFFEELSKQISLLIMDDDNDDLLPASHRRPSASFQAFPRVINPTTQTQFRDQSKGTGVFIPIRSSIYRRRKSKQGRFNNSTNTKFQHKQQLSTDNPRRVVPHAFQ